MRQCGSQRRETLEEAGVILVGWLPSGDVLIDEMDGEISLYTLRDDFAGHVYEIKGKGYEYVRQATAAELLEAMTPG